MKCPKCAEGTLKKILFKKDNQVGFLCDYCGNTWFEKDPIKANTGHFIGNLTKNDDMAYTFVDTQQTEEEKSVLYPKFK